MKRGQEISALMKRGVVLGERHAGLFFLVSLKQAIVSQSLWCSMVFNIAFIGCFSKYGAICMDSR